MTTFTVENLRENYVAAAATLAKKMERARIVTDSGKNGRRFEDLLFHQWVGKFVDRINSTNASDEELAPMHSLISGALAKDSSLIVGGR